jgi:hypothetical protein
MRTCYTPKKIKVAIIFIVIFLQLFIAQIPVVNSLETAKESASIFLSDVVGLDMRCYNTTVGTIVEDGPYGSGLKYRLVSNESSLEAIFMIKGNVYIFCTLYQLKGSPILTKVSSSSIKEETEDLLRRYENSFSATHVENILTGLEDTQDLKTGTTIIGNSKLETIVSSSADDKEDFAKMTWSRTVNGINNTFDIMSITFQKGGLKQFCDSWNIYDIGSDEIKVNQEEAIRIAKDNAFIHSGTSGEEFKNFTVVEKSITATLEMSPRNDSLLYPMWGIVLGLDKVYFNQVTQIGVSIWADTGEIAGISSGGGYGGQSNGNQPTTQPSSQTSNNNAQNSLYLIAGAVATALIMSTIGLALKRRKK